MMLPRRQFLHLATGAVALPALSSMAAAQSYPTRPVRLVVQVPAGAAPDIIARVVGQWLSDRLGQPVVIDNRPGGGTAIGLKAVMSSEADGHTLLFTNTPTHVFAQVVSKAFTYDPVKDFTPIVTVGSTSLVLVVPASLPVKTLGEFIAYAKANPGKLNVGFGQGTLPHLVSEAFKISTATDIASIPYRGGAQAITDMLGGRIHMNLGAGATLVPLIREGKIKALAVTSPQRGAELPEVPTMAESGHPELTTVTYYGFFGPAGTPADVVARINQEINEALKSAELRASMTKVGFEPTGGTAQEFAAIIAEQLKRFAPLAASTGFTME
jgi:tripartite-type tricarboxylate transporter receptor subunit TctC